METILNYFSSIDPVLGAFLATTFTWLVTAAGASLVFFFGNASRNISQRPGSSSASGVSSRGAVAAVRRLQPRLDQPDCFRIATVHGSGRLEFG